MQTNNFAALVSQHDGQLAATHLPLMLDAAQGEYGTLIGHMARANPQGKSLWNGEVMVIFQGPHTYISPNWYETHPSVPTWNYTVVHAYGTAQMIDDPRDVFDALKQLVDHHEAGFAHPWPMALPDDDMAKQMQALITFTISITRLEGKFKLSQNRSAADQAHVRTALAASDYAPDQAVSAMMEAEQGRRRGGA